MEHAEDLRVRHTEATARPRADDLGIRRGGQQESGQPLNLRRVLTPKRPSSSYIFPCYCYSCGLITITHPVICRLTHPINTPYVCHPRYSEASIISLERDPFHLFIPPQFNTGPREWNLREPESARSDEGEEEEEEAAAQVGYPLRLTDDMSPPPLVLFFLSHRLHIW